MNRKLIAAISAAVALAAVVLFLRGDLGTRFAWSISDGGTVLLPLVLISALLDSINPCAFAILLVTIAVLLGLGVVRGRLFAVGGAYVAGIFLSYLAIGLGLLGTLHLFNTPHFMGKVGAGLLIAWGIVNIVNEFFPAFPIKLRVPHAAHRKMAELMGRASLPAAFGLGALVGLCEFPCTGGPYLMVLGLLHDSATYLKGFSYLLLYNAVFVFPLLVVLAIAGNRTVVERLEAWKKSNVRSMRLWTGIAMLGLGVLILIL
ncbi:MAG TPA: GAP family protein [Candidatus Paceibacterota bacterium]|nr:GAP family protein [Candidatus Paceibacterota bacterium]